ncbi:MAG: hypothetical protein I8H91_02765 [Burkholderiales bacterium]|nr:hypothetical protein [Burkholderiales bacterium]
MTAAAGNIFFCSDMHGRFQHVIEAVHGQRLGSIVLLGDLQAQRPLEVEFSDILDRTEVWRAHPRQP